MGAKRIAVLVSNDLQGDSRVEKISQTLASVGSDVVVFGLGSARFPTYTTKNGFGIYRPACAITGNSVRDKTVGKKVPLKLQIYRWIKNGTRPELLSGKSRSGWESNSKLLNTPKPEGEREHQWRIDALEKSWCEQLIAWAPDAIHANDADTIGIAVRMVEELRSRGKNCLVIYDQHEFLPGIYRTDTTWREFMLEQEALHISAVDAVITVSDYMLKDLVERYAVMVPNATILNSPSETRVPVNPSKGTIRSVLMLDKDEPLHVYVGILNPKRGLHTAIEALSNAPGHHVAIVTRSKGKYFESLVNLAESLHVTERLHWLPYVPAEYVSTFISDATSGLTPLLHVDAHEVSLGTKFYEYLFAGLPIITSDVRVQRQAIDDFSMGEVFFSEDGKSLARAMQRISSKDRTYYTTHHAELEKLWSWESQGSKLLEIYRSIM